MANELNSVETLLKRIDEYDNSIEIGDRTNELVWLVGAAIKVRKELRSGAIVITTEAPTA